MTTHHSTDQPTVFRAQGVPDLIHWLSAQFGFHVTESLVLVTTKGPRHRLGISGRIDLPPADDHCAKYDAVNGILEPLERHGGEGLMILALSQDPQWAEEVVLTVMDSTALPVIVAAWATADRFWENGYSPAEGEPYVLDPAHEVIVSAVARGQRVARDRAELVRDVAPPTAERCEQIRDAEERLVDGGDLEPLQGRKQRRRRVRAGRAVLRKLAEGKTVAGDHLIQMGHWAEDLPVRDAWWCDLDAGNAEAMARAWLEVASWNTGPKRCAPLALAGFAAWQAGDGARARVAVEAALAEDQNYSLAKLIVDILDHAVHPRVWERRHEFMANLVV